MDFSGYACHIHGGSTRAYVKPGYEQRDDISTPVVDISSGATVGFRYLQFGSNTPKRVRVVLGVHKKVKVNLRVDSYRGRIAATLYFDENKSESRTELDFGIIGKHAVYFEFLSEEAGTVAEFDCFSFE